MIFACRIYLSRLICHIKTHPTYLIVQNNVFLLVLVITLFLLSLVSWIWIIFLIMSLWYITKLNRKLMYIAVIIVLMIGIKWCVYEKRIPFEQTHFQGVVYQKDILTHTNRYIVRVKTKKVIVYAKEDISIGTIILVTGEIQEPQSNRIENAFNYQAYLKHQHIRGIIKATEIDVIGNRFMLSLISHRVSEYFDSQFSGNSHVFLRAFLLGDKSYFSNEFHDSIRGNGIVHLFAISGLHIQFFIMLLSYMFIKLQVSSRISHSFISIFLVVYLIVTHFSPSILRASMMYFFALINKKLNMKFSQLDVASIVFVVLILFNPYYMYHMGFILSFLVCFVIILVGKMVVKYHPIIQTLCISLAAQMITLPVIISMQYQINVLSPITNVLFVYWVQLIILPASICTVLLPFLQPIYESLIVIFIQVSYLLSRFFTIPLKIGKFSSIALIAYYMILLLLIRSFKVKKYKDYAILLLVGFLSLTSNILYVTSKGNVYFLDLYYGEAIVIQTPFGSCKAVIDTGDGRSQDVTNFLKSKGIKQLDFLILTHNHADHNGEALAIISHFNPTYVVMSHYDEANINHDHIIRVQSGDSLFCGPLTFNIIHPDKNYYDENNNSIVIHTFIGHDWFLFTGDISKSIEEKLRNISVDILKVSHHGSRTSTSLSWLLDIRPHTAIIQTGSVVQFGFPHQETIDSLHQAGVMIYRTDEGYSITYQYSRRSRKIVTLNPS